MQDFPATWQLRQLIGAIDASRLTEDGFRFATGDYGGSITHEGYECAYFDVKWMPEKLDVTGLGGPGPPGDCHVLMAPGAEGPGDHHPYIRWAAVVDRFQEWVSYLAREFEASEDWEHFRRGRDN